jgi:hypothetical protein
MNERIEQFARQCTEYITGTLDGDFEQFDYKKFAELIVKECLKVSYNSADMLKSTNPAYSDGIMSNNLAIREHFGVEE